MCVFREGALSAQAPRPMAQCGWGRHRAVFLARSLLLPMSADLAMIAARASPLLDVLLGGKRGA